ncbi:MAG: hypothetical protein HYY52_07640 [Candidatus Melainabacteria bacterium]|nr:hypothetical protein [Candidatus Melainabacteria bacterium]
MRVNQATKDAVDIAHALLNGQFATDKKDHKVEEVKPVVDAEIAKLEKKGVHKTALTDDFYRALVEVVNGNKLDVEETKVQPHTLKQLDVDVKKSKDTVYEYVHNIPTDADYKFKTDAKPVFQDGCGISLVDGSLKVEDKKLIFKYKWDGTTFDKRANFTFETTGNPPGVDTSKLTGNVLIPKKPDAPSGEWTWQDYLGWGLGALGLVAGGVGVAKLASDENSAPWGFATGAGSLLLGGALIARVPQIAKIFGVDLEQKSTPAPAGKQ